MKIDLLSVGVVPLSCCKRGGKGVSYLDELQDENKE